MLREPRRERRRQQTVEAVRGAYVRVNGRWLINFTAANYLGLNQHHQIRQAICRAAAQPNFAVSLGMPRALAADPLTDQLEAEVAKLVHQEAALLFPSTTHIALDVLPLLAGPNGILFIDEWAYPISLDGAMLAENRGARIIRFPHNHVNKLAQQLTAHPLAAGKVIVCDGVYAAGGEQAKLHQFVRLAQRFNAIVYVDDAHGLGVLGTGSSGVGQYGFGGAGTPAHQHIPPGRHLIYAASFSKAFGVPVAFAAGADDIISHLRQEAPSLVHSSPPAIPMVAAALAALREHAVSGNARRGRLRRNILYFRRQLNKAGMSLAAGNFPIQTLPFADTKKAERMARHFRRSGVWSVLQYHSPDNRAGAVVRFILTAVHSIRDIETAITAILDC